jgi:hypothetical protein
LRKRIEDLCKKAHEISPYLRRMFLTLLESNEEEFLAKSLMETNKSCCVECGWEEMNSRDKNCSWFYIFLWQKKGNFYSIFMLLMLIGMEHKI